MESSGDDGTRSGLATVAHDHAVSVALQTRTPKRGHAPRRRWLPAGITLLSLLGLGLLGLYFWQPWTSASIWTASPGVIITREGQALVAAAQTALQPGDRIEVPTGGEAIFGYRDGTRIALAQRSALLFEPGTVPVYGELLSRDRRFFLESGSLTATLEKKSELVMYSPHVKAEMEQGILDLSVTLSSTRVAGRAHPVRLTHNQGGLVETLPADSERVVTGLPN